MFEENVLFVELTDTNGNPVLVAIEAIKYVHSIPSDKEEGGYVTSIRVGEGTAGEDFIHVCDSVEQVCKAIRGVRHVKK